MKSAVAEYHKHGSSYSDKLHQYSGQEMRERGQDLYRQTIMIKSYLTTKTDRMVSSWQVMEDSYLHTEGKETGSLKNKTHLDSTCLSGNPKKGTFLFLLLLV